MDPNLTTVLINNLLSNAIRHNHEKGFIRTFLDGKRFVISNSGPALAIAPDMLFDRFRKGRQRGDGLGLGLAIVKKICDYSGFGIKYHCENQEHSLCFDEGWNRGLYLKLTFLPATASPNWRECKTHRIPISEINRQWQSAEVHYVPQTQHLHASVKSVC